MLNTAKTQPRFMAPLLAAATAWAIAGTSLAGDPVITGAQRVGQPTTIQFDGPVLEEATAPGNGNPFLDWRVLCTITQPDATQVVVRGYFAADGDAANSHATEGDRWNVMFTPSQVGVHTFSVTLHQGVDVGVSSDPAEGTPFTHPHSFHGQTGTFTVDELDPQAPGFLGRGIARYDGKHFLRFTDGSYFLKGGTNSPEDLLAFRGFDDTTNKHHFSPHADDWVAGDPDWTDDEGDAGRNLIGALNYLSGKGMNSVYFLTMNVHGDGDNVWPWTGPFDFHHFDVSKLAQWEIVFSHMDALGIQLHVLTQETENDQLLNGGGLGVERKLYYCELISRFAHHNCVNWNLGEENTNTHAQRVEFCNWFETWDPYAHQVVVHHYPHMMEQVYNALLGQANFHGTSLQRWPHSVHEDTKGWVTQSAATGQPWVVCLDEQGPYQDGVVPDVVDYDHDEIRKDCLWGNLMAGGAGVEYYFGYSHAHSDLTCEDWRSRDHMWDLTDHALRFFRDYLPFDEMTPADELLSSTDAWCLALEGSTYAIYLPEGGSTDLILNGGFYSVEWYDPRNGGPLQAGSVTSIGGLGLTSLGEAPNEPAKDWVVLVRGTQPDPGVAVDYGTGKISSEFGLPTLTHSGEPNVGEVFELHVEGALGNTWGMLMHGPGRLAHPFFGGTLWINVPITRIQPILLNPDGTGSWLIPVDPSMVGVQRNYQLWFRDPNHPDGTGVGLSSAVDVTFGVD